MTTKRPLGVLILGSINCFVLGLIFLLFSISAYFSTTPADFEKVSEVIKSQGIEFDISFEKFKQAALFDSLLFVFFLISGIGLLFRKPWAPKFTVYFSFAWALLVFLVSLAHTAFLRQMLLQIIYPGILIVYFSNKEVVKYFKQDDLAVQTEQGSN